MKASIAALVAAVCVLSACAAPTTSAPGPGGSGPEPPVPSAHDWFGIGDSIFDGANWLKGAPSWLDGMHNAARGGNTLGPVTLFGVPQPSVRDQARDAVAVEGVPRHVVVHAGMADLFAEAVWGVPFSVEEAVARAVELTEWLTSMGIEVWWTTLTPFAAWSAPGAGGEREHRLAFNRALRDRFGERTVDCEPYLDPDGDGWAADDLVQPGDGAHLSRAGVALHAACLGNALGLAVVDSSAP